MARRNPQATVEYNRQRYLRLKNGVIIEKPKKLKKSKSKIKVGQKFKIKTYYEIVEFTMYYADVVMCRFKGKMPLIRIDRDSLEKYLTKEKR